MQGIYCIEQISTGRKYYGSSFNIDKRIKGHIRELKLNQHHNIFLQRCYVKYGSDDFVLYTVEETNYNEKQDLFILEQQYIYIDNNIGGFNLAPANGGDIISNHPDKESIILRRTQTVKKNMATMTIIERKNKYGRLGELNGHWANGGKSTKLCPVCNETRISINANTCGNCRDRTKDKNPFYGKTHSKETKEKISRKNNGKSMPPPEDLSYTLLYEITQIDTGEKRRVYGAKQIALEFSCSITNVMLTIERMKTNPVTKRSRFFGYHITIV